MTRGKTNCVHTLGGVSNAACSSRIRLLDPLTRKVPASSVAIGNTRVGHFASQDTEKGVPVSFKCRPLGRQTSVQETWKDDEVLDIPFCYNDRNMTPHKQLSVVACSRNLHTCAFETLSEWSTEHCALWRPIWGRQPGQ